MRELSEADKKIHKILIQCEEEGDTFDETLNKITGVKVHGVTFPTLMLMEIIEEFNKGYEKRQKLKFDTNASDEELQKKYASASHNWNSKVN